MVETGSGRASNIYDLGYQPYQGQRLGRSYGIQSLYIYSLRAVFGLGRSNLSKVFPIGLAVVALLPATVQLGIAAIATAEIQVIKPENYFTFVQTVLALFCAVVAPEIIGRDQRHKTLPLYFSRALTRVDYVSAKLAALFVALFLVCLVPQVLLFLGSAMATDELTGYLRDNLDQVAPILASCAVVSVFMAAVSLATGSQTHRRAFATGAVLAYFVVFGALGSILVQTTTGDVQRYVLLLSPLDVLNGAVFWIFGASPARESDLAESGLGGYFLLAVLAYIAVALAVLYRRFQRLPV